MNLIKEIKKLGNLEKFFLFFLITVEIYYAYRYVLRYGSPISPLGYIETPFWFQAGKFIFVLFFLFFGTVLILKKFNPSGVLKILSRKFIWPLIVLFIAYITLSLAKIGFQDSFGFTQTLKMLFVIPFALFMPFIWRDKIPRAFFKVFIVFSLAYHLVYNFFMIAMFYLFGRLPGLVISPVLGRFGGGWDDPNSFAAFVVLFTIIFLLVNVKKKDYWWYTILFSLLIISLFYTFSITGLIGLVISLIILFGLKNLQLKRLLIILTTSCIVTLIFYKLNYFGLIYEAKLASSQGHLVATSTAPKASYNFISIISRILFGLPDKVIFHENFYWQLFTNYGIIAFSLFLLIITSTIFRSYKNWSLVSFEKDPEKKIFFLTLLVYLPAFSIMNISIPLFQVFPINLFVWVMIGLAWVLETRKVEL